MSLIPHKFKTTADVRQSRLEICAECPHRLFNGGLLTCKKCGCAMKFKTWLKGASCPLQKWKAVE